MIGIPDWIVHLGSAYFVGRLVRLKDLRLFFLGSVLPDVSRIALLGNQALNLNAVDSFLYFEPFHTPLMAALIALGIAFFYKKVVRYFLILFGASILHFALDLMEIHMGSGVLLLYPLSFEEFSLDVAWWESSVFYILLVVSSLCLILYFLWKDSEEKAKFSFRAKNLKFIFPLVLIIFALPLLTAELFIKNNVHYLDFFIYPEKWEGKEVKLSKSRVISLDPLVVRKMGNSFEVAIEKGPAPSIQNVKQGDRISIIAIYNQGKLHPHFIHRHYSSLKTGLSLTGLLILALIWIGFPEKWREKWRF